MTKNAKPQDSTSDKPTKAGRKKKYIAPPPPNQEKQDARRLGEQQFHSKENFTVEVPTVKMVGGVLVHAVKHVAIPYKYDPTRKRLVNNTFWNPGPDGNGRAPR